METLDRLQSKIIDKDGLRRVSRAWKLKCKTIAFTNGCFDILHVGHLNTFAYAADRSDILVVAINSDESVKRLKGDKRPIVNQEQRALMLAALQMVDAVVIFNKDTPIDVIEYLKPDLLVKGGDWAKKDIVGADIVEAEGGKVESVPFIEGISSTILLNKMGG
ncbi:MAG: rfaE bifunctional protein nucleotidyltransferase chain/domain [Limisphaerales bacterium]|jgi:rfaE bifunctional protein nucleotidyltransferase chain/domain